MPKSFYILFYTKKIDIIKKDKTIFIRVLRKRSYMRLIKGMTHIMTQ